VTHSHALRKYQFESGDLEVVVKRQRRKSLALHINSPDEVEIRAPLKCSWSLIDGFIFQKETWIFDAIASLKQRPPTPRPVFAHGEKHNFLGKEYAMEVCQGTPALVFVLGDKIVIRSRNPGRAGEVERLFMAFLKTKAYGYFPGRIQQCRQKFMEIDPTIAMQDGAVTVIGQDPLTGDEPELNTGFHIRRMKARWGSCSSRGELCFNSLLMQKSEVLIDLVIVHELCHLRHFSHNKAFYGLLEKVLPDWRIREKLLDGIPLD